MRPSETLKMSGRSLGCLTTTDYQQLVLGLLAFQILILAAAIHPEAASYHGHHHNHHQFNESLQLKVQNGTQKQAATYANHRMSLADETSEGSARIKANHTSTSSKTGNATLGHHHRRRLEDQPRDRDTADSMLRPQLALQIYANEGAGKAAGQEGRSAASTMLIVPIHGELAQQGQRKRELGKGSPPQDYGPAPQLGRQPRASSNGNGAKLNPWHYVTDQLASGPDAAESYLTPRAPSDRSALINAIITVPASAGGEEQQVSLPQLMGLAGGGGGRVAANLSLVDQSVARLMESQAAGDLEFTMNLNGEEITINPAAGRQRPGQGHHRQKPAAAAEQQDQKSSTAEQLADQAALEADEPVAPPRGRFVSRGAASRDNKQHGVSRAIRGHVDRELTGADQQSASELDLVDDEAGDATTDEAEIEFEPRASDGDAAGRPRPKPGAASALDSVESSPSEATDKEELPKAARKSRWSSSASSMDDESSASHQEDSTSSGAEQSPDESSQSEASRVTSASAKRQQANDEPRKGSSRSQVTNPKSAAAAAAAAQQRSGGRQRGRKSLTAGSKRRQQVAEKENTEADEGDEGANSDPGDRQQEPSVVIKGEDVRRFEQLLENLRQMQLNGKMASKRQKAKVQQQRKQPPQDNQEDAAKGGDESNEEVAPARSSKKQLASRLSAARDAPEADELDDCERRRQQRQRAASSGLQEEAASVNYDQESSPNIVDQDPMTSGGGGGGAGSGSDGDDAGDEGADGQLAEQDEQSSDNHNKISLPQSDMQQTSAVAGGGPAEKSFGEKQQALGNRDANDDKGVYVRKTVLQSFYDNNQAAAASQNSNPQGQTTSSSSSSSPPSPPPLPQDDLKSIHDSQHESLHERHAAASSSQQPAATTLVYRRQYLPKTSHQYIDYNHLDDRDVIRASESRKIRVVIAPAGKILSTNATSTGKKQPLRPVQLLLQ